MKLSELNKLLQAGEWNDVEFKEARTDVPKSAFETVSAFANTNGGRLVFGVGQRGDVYEVIGVEKPDKVQNDFLSVLHADAKINHDVAVTERKLDIGGKTVLVFQVSENQRTRKAVYLNAGIRRDDPPGFRVFREAAVNLLIHQDYGDHSPKAVIKFFRDGIQVWNPGDVFGDDSRLWEPGEKEVRNPSIAMAMRRIAMCEQAGTGLRMMREAWRKLGHPSPSYKNDRAGKAFELFIPELDKEVDMASDLVKAMFGAKSPTQSGDPVKAQVQAHEAHGQAHDEAHEAQEAQVEAQEAQVEAQVEMPKWQRSILTACSLGEKTGKELLAVAGYRNRTGNFKKGLHRLVDEHFLELTIPDKPNSRLQKYRLTDKGRQVLTKTCCEAQK